MTAISGMQRVCAPTSGVIDIPASWTPLLMYFWLQRQREMVWRETAHGQVALVKR